MITMYKAVTIGIEIKEIQCKSFTNKTVLLENGRRINRDGGWCYICESRKESVEWLKSIFENRVKLEENHLERANYDLRKFTEKYIKDTQ